MKRQKSVVILHGFPEALSPESPLFRYFLLRGYRIILPDLFSDTCLLNRKEIETYVRGELGGEKADVIVGVSMGGLIAPSLATRYPKVKLILIGTGPYFKTPMPFYNFLIRLESRDPALFLVRLARTVPGWLYRWIYRSTHKRKYALSDEEYRGRPDKSWGAFVKISFTKIRELLRLITQIDNTQLLKRLHNKTLIFAGTHDSLMPPDLSLNMNNLIPGSRIIILDRLHYDVFTKKEYRHLDIFLKTP